MRSMHWSREEIARLDPQHDARRITQLVMEVRFGNPLLMRPLFSLAFARQVAVPAIAETLYRGGRGIILHDTAKRHDDTLVFFGLLFQHLGTPDGDRVVRRIVDMHKRFSIPNDLNLYTLATLACLPQRMGRQLTGRDLLSPKEGEALHHFWTRFGLAMGIEDIPPDHESMMSWMIAFEEERYAPTEGGRAVTQALAREIGETLLPRAIRPLGRHLFFALFDDRLREVHGVDPPHRVEAALISTLLRTTLQLNDLLPDGSHDGLVQRYSRGTDINGDPDKVGPTKAQQDDTMAPSASSC